MLALDASSVTLKSEWAYELCVGPEHGKVEGTMHLIHLPGTRWKGKSNR